MLLAEVNQHRSQLMAITEAAKSDLTTYARSVADLEPARFAGEVRDAAVAVVGAYGPVAGENAALFYETQRPSPRPARVVAPSVGEALQADLSWALFPLFRPELFPDPWGSVVSNLGGVAQRAVASGDRETMLLNAERDDLSQGVRRFARAGACAFCAYLTSVVDVVDDDVIWHRNCHCVSVPWWEDNPLPYDPNVDRWAASAERARLELERLQFELKPPGMRWRNFFKANPDLVINTKNIARLMRADLGIAH
jgi:hypothetical protein